jgi:carbon storage regulator
MLVLTRKRGERIMIGEDVVITVLEVSGDQVRVGIEAPRSVKVMREEVLSEVEKANRDARMNKYNKFKK